jgi:phosphatidylinositol dimannoside acyltransferase
MLRSRRDVGWCWSRRTSGAGISGGAWLAGRGYPLVTVVERLRPRRLLEWFLEVRRRHGITVLVRGPGVRDQLVAALERNEVVVLVCDRDLGGRGVIVEFFGERTTLPPGPARLARQCGAPLIPVAIYHIGDGQHRGVARCGGARAAQ